MEPAPTEPEQDTLGARYDVVRQPQWSRPRRSRNSSACNGGNSPPPRTSLNGAGPDGAGTGGHGGPATAAPEQASDEAPPGAREVAPQGAGPRGGGRGGRDRRPNRVRQTPSMGPAPTGPEQGLG